MSRRKETRRSGINPLAYLGVEPVDPIAVLTYDRPPTTEDKYNFRIGTIWLDRSKTPEDVWILVNLDDDPVTGVDKAKWIMFSSGAEVVFEYHEDIGIAIPSGGNLNVFGSSIITTAGAGNTISINMTSSLDGQIIIGGGAEADWNYITSLGGTVAVTNLPGSINLEAIGAGGLLTLTGDGATVATAALGNINMFGGVNINTSAIGDTITIALNDNVTIASSLTLLYEGAGVMQTTAVGLVFSDNGLDGEVLIGGGTEPNWNNITSLDGSFIITNGPNTINLETSGGPPPAQRFSFFAYQSNSGPSLIDGDIAYFGAGQTIIERFDIGNNFYPGSAGAPFNPATFTAPAGGKYWLQLHIWVLAVLPPPIPPPGPCDPIVSIAIETDNRIYYHDNRNLLAGDYDERWSYNMAACVDMDLGDTAIYSISSFGNPIPYTVHVAGDGLEARTFFSGYLIEQD